jgi:hypothetical protein
MAAHTAHKLGIFMTIVDPYDSTGAKVNHFFPLISRGSAILPAP